MSEVEASSMAEPVSTQKKKNSDQLNLQEPCPCRVRAMSATCRRSEKRKDTAWTPEFSESYRYQYFAKNDVSVQFSH